MGLADFCAFHVAAFTVGQQRAILKGLWGLLQADDNSHFLYEYGYLLVRATHDRADEYKAHFEQLGLEYEYHNEWIEHSDVVIKYLPFFIDYFHLISVLAMTIDAKDGPQITERIAHCFYNAACLDWRQEDDVMMEIARGRSRLIGASMAIHKMGIAGNA